MTVAIRDYRAEDAPGVTALWQAVFGRPRGGQTAEWVFRSGPAGEAPRVVAEAEGRIVALGGAAPLRFRLAGADVLGAYSVGAMTAPEARGQRLFFRIGEHLYARLEREGFAFVAGFSNRVSHRLMTGPLGRVPIRPFPWCVRVLRPVGAARALLRGGAAALPPAPEPPPRQAGDVRVAVAAPDDPRIDAVWKRAADSVEVGAVRDAAFSAWRFATRPDADYRLLLAERAGEPVGHAVYRALPLRGLAAGFVTDLVLAPGEAGAARELLLAVEDLARVQGVQLLNALLPGRGPVRDALLAAGYHRVPERLHPQLIRFSVRGLGRFADEPRLVDPAAWFLSWADTDVV